MIRTRNLGIDLDQGADFEVIIGVYDTQGAVNLAGYSFLGEIKETTSSNLTANPVLAEFTFSILNQFTNKGQVLMSLPYADSDEQVITTSVSNALQKKRLGTPFVFDVKMKDATGKVSRIIQGIISVSPEATQEVFT